MTPHLGHTELIIVVVTASVHIWALIKNKDENMITITDWSERGSICMVLALDLHLQASTPSNHLWPTFLLPAPPQFLYQAPPGAQQLALPDLWNVAHFGHVISFLELEVMAGVLVVTGVLIDTPTISSRPGIGRRDGYRRDGYRRAVVDVHTCDDIDPNAPVNIAFLLAFEWTQAGPHSLCLNDATCQFQNM